MNNDASPIRTRHPGRSWQSPRQYYDAYRDTFEPMSLMVMTVHCHFGGRPLMASVFNELPGCFGQFSDVWFARHRELAQWALESEFDEYAGRFLAPGSRS